MPLNDLQKMTHRELVKLLRNVNPMSLWGAAVRKVVDGKPTPDQVTELIRELRSQAKDNRQMMKEILGHHIFETII